MGNFHDWSEKEFDWKSLDKAITLIHKVMNLFRIGVHSKEKYGTARIDVQFFDGSLHHLVYPGYVWNKFPDWLMKLDYYYFKPFMVFTKLYKIIHYIQKRGYTFAYYLAMKKYPHIKEEICVDADFPELIFGGNEIHNQYWKGPNLPAKIPKWWEVLFK